MMRDVTLRPSAGAVSQPLPFFFPSSPPRGSPTAGLFIDRPRAGVGSARRRDTERVLAIRYWPQVRTTPARCSFAMRRRNYP